MKHLQEDDVPVVVDSLSSHEFSTLIEQFSRLYGHPPNFIARAPGRVNLIGEHVDYSGYPVLPMAIVPSSTIAVSISKGSHSNVANVDPQFASFKIPVAVGDVVIDPGQHSWANYVKCGYKGILEHLKLPSSIPFNALVHGTVPMGSGLSSSSALVCASALVTMRVNGASLQKTEIADVCKSCEHYVGTMGGGMDQAISFLGKKGSASLISFNPLSTKNMNLPEDCVFFVANSFVESSKVVTVDTCYNMRVVECRLAAKLLAKALNQPWRTVSILKHVQDNANLSLDEMIALTKKHIHVAPYTPSEVALSLGINEEELQGPLFIGPKIKSTQFHLYYRALHVFLESKLVQDFASLCLSSPPPSNQSELLGQLMNSSHFSCDTNFNCSCPELNELTSLCRASGALGARLTGAGWGGCVVALVPKSKASSFFQSVLTGYYKKYHSRFPKVDLADTSNYFFSTAPGPGALLFLLTNGTASNRNNNNRAKF